MTDKIIAEYVHWRDTYTCKQFIIMWSDHTWELIRCPFKDYWIGDKTYKQFMELGKITSSKLTKEEVIKFINKKFEEARQYC